VLVGSRMFGFDYGDGSRGQHGKGVVVRFPLSLFFELFAGPTQNLAFYLVLAEAAAGADVFEI
jgi:hypothetical protein